MILKRNFKYRIYPTIQQEHLLLKWQGILKFLWNICLEQRLNGLNRGPKLSNFGLDKKDPSRNQHKIFINYYEQKRQMTEMLEIAPWIEEVQCQARQEILADLDKAWNSWAQKTNIDNGLPRFKKYKDSIRIYIPKTTVPFNISGDRKSGILSFKGPRYIPLGNLKIIFDRSFPNDSQIKSWTLFRGRKNNIKAKNNKTTQFEWYAVAACEIEIVEPKHLSKETIGIDVGLTRFLTDSENKVVENPKFSQKEENRICRLQRKISKKKKGSANQQKERIRLAKLQMRIARRREHFINVQSRIYAANYKNIVVEDLPLKNLTASAKGSLVEPGKNVAQKTGLNRSFADVAIGNFFQQLKYKAEEKGGFLIKVNPKYTSQKCSECKHIDSENRKAQSKFKCIKCDFELNADLNAAINIKNLGIESLKTTQVKKQSKKIFSRGRKPKAKETAVKSTVVQPVEDNSGNVNLLTFQKNPAKQELNFGSESQVKEREKLTHIQERDIDMVNTEKI